MPTGLSGDDNLVLGNDPVTELNLLELRVISTLMETQMGTAFLDGLGKLRNDYAVQLGIPVPVAGASN